MLLVSLPVALFPCSAGEASLAANSAASLWGRNGHVSSPLTTSSLSAVSQAVSLAFRISLHNSWEGHVQARKETQGGRPGA
jgi:hypothetical protein